VKIHELPVNRRWIKLKISCMYNKSYRGCYTEANSIDYAVSFPYEFYREDTKVYDFPRLSRNKFNIFEVMFAELFFYQSESQRSPIYRDIYFFEQKRKSAGMVFMAVCKNYTLYLLPVIKQIRKIRDDKIHSEHIFLREHKAGINNNNISIVFEDCHVEADLLNPAERDYR